MNDEDPPTSDVAHRFLDVLGEYEALEQAALAGARAAFALNATLGHAAAMVTSTERKKRLSNIFAELFEREMDLRDVLDSCFGDLAFVAQSNPSAGASAARRMLHEMHARVVQAMIGVRSCDALYRAAMTLAPGADWFRSSSPLKHTLDAANDAVAEVDFMLCEGLEQLDAPLDPTWH